MNANEAFEPFWHPGRNPAVNIILLRNIRKQLNAEVLLIKRNGQVERGKWAFPGGFHDTTAPQGAPWTPGLETEEEAAWRELKEEAGLLKEDFKGTELILIGTYEGSQAQKNDPRDDDKAWSYATSFALVVDEKTVITPKAGDDAEETAWAPLSKALKMPLAFNHNQMLLDACKKLEIKISEPNIR